MNVVELLRRIDDRSWQVHEEVKKLHREVRAIRRVQRVHRASVGLSVVAMIMGAASLASVVIGQ